MKMLPNGLKIFNATPHSLTFWDPTWDDVVTIQPDEPINARPVERVVGQVGPATLVTTAFEADELGRAIIDGARSAGADLIVGSLIAAQAYPGQVVAMVPAPGFERVPPEQKRMRPDRFTVYRA